MQIKAGLKKEFMLFSRTFKMWGILITFFAFAIIDPLLFMAMNAFMEGVGANEATAALGELASAISATAETGVMGAISDITASGVLILLLLMMSTAGGEQKKRSVIIPSCAGLTPMNYTLPKFVFYPLFTFAAAFAAIMFSGVISLLCFGGELDWLMVMGEGALAGLYIAFIASTMLMAGICTGKAGISVAVIYVLATLIPLILSGMNADRYNPFSLKTMALSGEFDTLNLIGSLAITIILMLIFFFVTLFVQNARKIDNEGKDIAL